MGSICGISLGCSLQRVSLTQSRERRYSQLKRISILFGILSFTTLMSTRVAGRAMMHALRSYGRNLRNILIVGTNLRSDSFARDIALHPEWAYRVQGFIDEQWW